MTCMDHPRPLRFHHHQLVYRSTRQLNHALSCTYRLDGFSHKLSAIFMAFDVQLTASVLLAPQTPYRLPADQ